MMKRTNHFLLYTATVVVALLVVSCDSVLPPETTSTKQSPQQLPAETNKNKFLQQSEQHSQMQAGTVLMWGREVEGLVETESDDFIAISAGGFGGTRGVQNLLLSRDGTIASLSADGLINDVPEAKGNDFVAISAGGSHSMALREDGSIVAWGDDTFGQISNTPSGGGFRAISAGSAHSLALREDGTIAAWGDDRQDQVSDTPAGDDFVAISAGQVHSLALREDGTITGWGLDAFGQVSDAPTESGFVALDSGDFHALALHEDGAIAAWGWDDFNQVSKAPEGDGFAAVAAGVTHSMALREDGTIVAWGGQEIEIIEHTPGEAGFIAISAKNFLNMAIRAATALDTPAESVERLIQRVIELQEEGVLRRGETRGLMATLEAASRQIDRSHFQPARNQINAFINQVEAFRSNGTLSEELADELTGMAGNILQTMAEEHA